MTSHGQIDPGNMVLFLPYEFVSFCFPSSLINKANMPFFWFIQSCIPQIFTMSRKPRDMNALPILSSKQIRVYLQKYFTFPNSKPYAILLEAEQINSPQAVSWFCVLCGGSRVHCSPPRGQQMILLHMWRAHFDISSQFHKGNCQMCTPAPPWGMMSFCPSATICIQYCVFSTLGAFPNCFKRDYKTLCCSGSKKLHQQSNDTVDNKSWIE